MAPPTSAVRSAGKWFALGAVGVIGLSLVTPGSPIIPAVGVGLFFVGIAALLVQRPRGRPSSHSAMRLSAYGVRVSVVRIPVSVLVGFSIWEIVSRSLPAVGHVDRVLFVGLIAGAVWGLVTRFVGAPLSEWVAGAVGVIGLGFAFATAVGGNACADALQRPSLVLILAIFAVSAVLAVVVGVAKTASIHHAHLGAYVLALFGLLELAKFSVAPAGEDLLTGAPLGAKAGIVAGLGAVAVLAAINPRLAESLVGVALAVAGTYLAVFDARLGGAFEDCTRLGRSILVVGPVAVVSIFVGKRE